MNCYWQEVLTDTFESSVKDLQLFLVEVGLLHKTVDALRSVTHCWQLTIVCYTSCTGGQRCDTMSPWHTVQVFIDLMFRSSEENVSVCVLTLALIDWGAGARATAGEQFEEALLYGLFTGFGWRITWKRPITAEISGAHTVAQIVDTMSNMGQTPHKYFRSLVEWTWRTQVSLLIWAIRSEHLPGRA